MTPSDPCEPSVAHPLPVVLVHGLGANQSQNWSYISPRLAAEGYCVFSLTYGRTHSNPATAEPADCADAASL
ncbi:MAG TPA: hypothetical protein VNT32_10960 [Thermoleophilaceae bacterium]|nr:hypothetical protein [Thermoleophilaceae bacterium]